MTPSSSSRRRSFPSSKNKKKKKKKLPDKSISSRTRTRETLYILCAVRGRISKPYSIYRRDRGREREGTVCARCQSSSIRRDREYLRARALRRREFQSIVPREHQTLISERRTWLVCAARERATLGDKQCSAVYIYVYI